MRIIQDNTATATARRIFLLIYDDTTALAPWTGSVTGVKAQLSVNGGSETASTADIVRVAGALHYVELTQAEADRAVGDRIHARVAGASGRREAIGAADISADNVFAAAATDASISTQTLSDLAGTPGASARGAIADTLLGRNHEGGANGGRTVSSALATVRNRVTRSGNTLTVYAADDTTVLYTAVVTGDANATPMVEINPA